MILLEFAAQGIRGVAPTGGRATLRPGYNVVAADGGVLRRLLDALLFPDGAEQEPLPRAPGGPANAPLRAGLTLLGDDRITYRLVRDFGGAAQLHRFDAEKRSFALVAQELAQIAEVLRTAGGVPPQARYSALLCLAAADLPSKQGGLAASAPATAPRTSLSPAQLQKKIADLKGELAKAKVSEKLQGQQDVLQARVFKLDEALKAGTKLQEGLARAEEEQKALAPVAAVLERLGDADARIAAFEKADSKREEALARVAAEREALDAAEAAGAPPGFWTDRNFLAGAGAGAAALLLGIVGAAGGGGPMRYLALLSVPAFGFAAWTAFGWVAKLEAWEPLARRRRVVDDWERKMLDQFDKDAAAIRGAMQELGVEKVQDLRDLATRLADGESVGAEWRRRLAEWKADPEIANARAERAKATKELQTIEARLLAEAGGFIRDVRSIEAEIQRLEGELANPAPAQAAPVTAPARPAGDPLRLLLEGAAKELGASPAAAVRGIQQKASQTLSGITFQRISGVSADDRGNLMAQTGGRLVPAATLPAADRDVLFIALKLGFMEAALAQGKAVAYVDDCFAGLSDGARRLVARVLKQLARPGQVVHATSDGSFKEAADHSA